jgi:hypothetical protein
MEQIKTNFLPRFPLAQLQQIANLIGAPLS